MPTLQDIGNELAKPGLDPRTDYKSLEFANVYSISDLTPGWNCPVLLQISPNSVLL